MPEAASGFNLDPDGDDFILSRTDHDGVTAKISLTAADILALTRSALAIRERSLSQRQPAGGAVEAVLATPVTEVELNRELLGDNILLTMISADGNRLTFALPSTLAVDVAGRIADLSEGQASSPPPRQ
ncbi:MAG: hypothetical protein C3F11_03090 [Methylocystaceae bacterium]|nr:MAG: hypothetical protein C3F11_03090 [Methylocystaceae bacterium]